MKLKVLVTEVVCEIELDPINDENGDMKLTSQASINGEVYLYENGLAMPLLSEEDRRRLTNRFRDAICGFVIEDKLNYGIEVNEDEA